jgi:hypothetical protein
MLIRDEGASWTAIGQPAHAWMAGGIARAWGNDRFAAPLHREDFCLGAEQHDVGWSAWDLEPPLHPPARRAASFYEAPIRPRMEIWVGAPQRVLAQSPIAALLVSLHGTNIHTRYVSADHLEPGDRDFVRRYVDEQRALQDRLCAATGIARDEAERMGELLFCLDAISLSLCHGWPERELPPVDGVEITYRPRDNGSATLEPWPLRAGELALHVHARTLTERFDDEAAMHAALGDAPWSRLDMALRA